MESIQKHFPKAILPVEYSGDGESVQENIEKWKNNLESYREYFLEEKDYGWDISKRMENSCASYGIQGSFRKLEID